MKPRSLFRLAFVLCGGLLGCSTASTPPSADPLTNVSTAALTEIVSKDVEQKFPELVSAGSTGGTPQSGAVSWHGDEYGTTRFVLKNDPRHPRREFPRAPRMPLLDLAITIVRYGSVEDAAKDLEKNLLLRPAMTPSKESYRGASLYRYASGAGNAICQSGPYIVEVQSLSEHAGPFTMKVLDVVLDALSSAKSEAWHGFPVLPPISNANPSIRVPLAVRVPTMLKIERTADTLAMELDQRSFEVPNLTVGTNMVTGVRSVIYVYPDGEPRPPTCRLALGTDFNLGQSVWHTEQDGLPLPGKGYIVEVSLIAFETDIPPQHAWNPQGSKNYKVLWQRTLKQTVQ